MAFIDVQRRLVELNYDPGALDGLYGPNSERAILAALATTPVAEPITPLPPEPTTGLHMSDNGLMALAHHEGIVKSKYKDSVGVWTIAIGHTAAAGPPDPATYQGEMSADEIATLFRKDLVAYEDDVKAAVTEPVNQHEFDALVSFHYNTGAIARATLTETLNAGNHELAGQQFMNWCQPPEITNRRQAESTLFLTGKYPEPYATVYDASSSGAVIWSSGRSVDLRPYL